MEQHFILRLIGELQNSVDIFESKFEKLNEKSINMIYKNHTYPGIIVKLPCIIESQKTLDKKQYYKICDISTLIVIYPNSNYDFDKERKILELSGLSAPLKYVKARRFRKNHNGKAQMISEIEHQVNKLIEKDKKAYKTEIVGEDKDVSDTEISDIAAELEDNFEFNETKIKKEEQIEENTEIISLKNEIEKQEKLVENALNPILKQRFFNKLEILQKKLEDIYKLQNNKKQM